ncbi:MAG: fibronectin type III domain-containing protein [Deltaproteobacteria bacterium]|nr:fibronectin type III domain-containing protein [Deltaproteobacteria bacterium]
MKTKIVNALVTFILLFGSACAKDRVATTGQKVTQTPAPPAAPSNLSASVQAPTEVNLTWKDNSNNEDAFVIKRSEDAGALYSEIGQVGSNETHFQDAAAEANTTYYYRVSAKNAAGEADSNVVSLTTPVQVGVLTAPSALMATVNGSRNIDLQWVDNSSGETGFVIERASQDSGPFNQIAIETGTSHSDANLVAGHYSYRVKALGPQGQSEYSNVASVELQALAPASPSNLTATVVSRTQIDLNWQDSSNNEDQFLIERRIAPNSFQALASLPSPATSYSDSTLSLPANADSTIEYRVRAANEVGNSDFSNIATVMVPAINPAPTAPSNFTATAVSANQIDLRWQDNSTNESGFKIERSSGDGASFEEIAQVEANVSTYEDSGREPGHSFTYHLTAWNDNGDSAAVSVSATTFSLSLPERPTDLTASASGSAITLSWQQDTVTNVVNFKVERKIDNDFSLAGTVDAPTLTYEDSSVAAQTQYTYRVQACNTSGCSPYSDPVEARVSDALLAPSDLSGKSASLTQIDLTWKDNSSEENGFIVERSDDGETFNEVGRVGQDSVSYKDPVDKIISFRYRVRAYYMDNLSSPSNEIAITPSDPNIPKAPTNCKAVAENATSVVVSWKGITKNIQFLIQRKTGNKGFSNVKKVSAKKMWLDKGLCSNREYIYRIRAQNKRGVSEFCPEVTVRLNGEVLSAPSKLRVKAVKKMNELHWQDNSKGEIAFHVERKIENGSFEKIAHLNKNHRQFNDKKVSNNKTYTYRVRAIGRLSTFSAYSEEVSVTRK